MLIIYTAFEQFPSNGIKCEAEAACWLEKMCVNPTWSIEEVFDLEAKQRRRDTRFTVSLCGHSLQPVDAVVQGFWESFSWVWTTGNRPRTADDWIQTMFGLISNYKVLPALEDQ